MKKSPSQLGTLCILAAIATANVVSAVESIRVDGVKIYGKIHAVPVASIREAIKASTNLAEGKPRRLKSLTRARCAHIFRIPILVGFNCGYC